MHPAVKLEDFMSNPDTMQYLRVESSNIGEQDNITDIKFLTISIRKILGFIFQSYSMKVNVTLSSR